MFGFFLVGLFEGLVLVMVFVFVVFVLFHCEVLFVFHIVVGLDGVFWLLFCVCGFLPYSA